MGEEEPKKATESTETETPDPVPATPPLQATDQDDQDRMAVEKKEEEKEEKKDQEKAGKEEEKKDVAEEKKSLSPVPQEKAVQKIADPVVEKNQEVDRDAVLAQVETEKRLALIKAWEESEKTKSENKAYKKLSAVGAWENSKKAAVEAELRAIEEKLAKKRAEYTEKMKNKVAEVHKLAEEKRAFVEANRREECLKVEETAAKFRASGFIPKKFLRCFGS